MACISFASRAFPFLVTLIDRHELLAVDESHEHRGRPTANATMKVEMKAKEHSAYLDKAALALLPPLFEWLSSLLTAWMSAVAEFISKSGISHEDRFQEAHMWLVHMRLLSGEPSSARHFLSLLPDTHSILFVRFSSRFCKIAPH